MQDPNTCSFVKKGILGYSQRKGIITLIFKNGERENLQNWRPITLLNIDYKLITTVLANRLQKVLHILINEDQVGYVKGRRGTDVARLIQDVIDFANTQPAEWCLFFVDFHKAFDTLEWNFIQNCLKAYGFKAGFVKWVALIYTEIFNKVILNGWLTDNIFPSRGVRQGCPLSALLFILAIEMIAIKLRDTELIQGISVGQANKEIKIAQLADDMTLFVKNKKSAHIALEMIDDFGEKSGVKLNKDKTKALWLGKGNPSHIVLDIPWADSFVKSLGIYFSRHTKISNDLNWSEERILKIKRILDLWKGRYLTYKGKIVMHIENIYFIKTCVYSTYNYMSTKCVKQN